VVDGKSESVLNVALNDLRGPQYVINVHKSAKEAKVYVSCGEIIEESMMQKEGEGMMPAEGGSATGGKKDEGTMMKDEGMMDKDSMMAKGETKTFSITGQSYAFSQKEIRVKKGDKVRVTLRSGDWPHDWTVDEFNARTKIVNKGEEASIEFVADRTGNFEYYCSVANHRQMGMVGKLVVE
jgi:plastocyanin